MIGDNCIAQMFLDQDITGGSREEFESQVLPAHSFYYEYSKYVETQKSGVTLKQYVIGRRDTDLGTLIEELALLPPNINIATLVIDTRGIFWTKCPRKSWHGGDEPGAR